MLVYSLKKIKKILNASKLEALNIKIQLILSDV